MPGGSHNKKVQVYYDGECPLCSRFITSVNSSSQKENFTCRPMQNLDKNDLLSQEFHIITQDGNVYRKFDAVLKIGEIYPKWRFVAKCARLPVLYNILSFGYEMFAAHRYGISKLLERFVAL